MLPNEVVDRKLPMFDSVLSLILAHSINKWISQTRNRPYSLKFGWNKLEMNPGNLFKSILNTQETMRYVSNNIQMQVWK